MFAKIVAFLAIKGLAVAPYAVKAAPAVVMVASGVTLYLVNKSNALDLGLMAVFAVSGAFVAAQIADAAKS